VHLLDLARVVPLRNSFTGTEFRAFSKGIPDRTLSVTMRVKNVELGKAPSWLQRGSCSVGGNIVLPPRRTPTGGSLETLNAAVGKNHI
jgi:hypothetical protein